MEQRMLNAACSGDVNMLQQLLQENPFILSDYLLLNSHENPLTIATKANQLVFVREVLRLRPELAVELNQDGFRPLDVAAAYGHVEIAAEILAAGPEICRLAGRDGRTAIHYAATNGRVEIIDQLMSACSDSAKDVTTFGETALHLAVKSFKFESLKSVLHWLEKVGMVEIVELLLDWNNNTAGNRLDLNAVNKKGLTAVDIVDILTESSNDVHLRETLRRAGGYASSEFKVVSERPKSDTESNGTAFLNPNISSNGTELMRRSSAETASMASITIFLVANSVALTTSTSIIDYLTQGLPFQRELRVSMTAMIFAYSWSLGNTKPTGTLKTVLLVVALSMPLFLRVLPYMISKLKKRNPSV
ncbi:UNVERIFIED_CONTAM: hypothetical protein Sradi_1078400 [Sesamum radiatum]|uniref:Uncharacterized protein n=1 Tax=Sesamum radiatum TaxID=300843 RepID=A0AAW2V7M2_SESRA